MKALIKVGYSCNEHCSFCHTQDVRHIDAPAEEVETKIRRAGELGHSMVVLSGGEPTIRPELLDWAALVAELGMDFGLVTNGLMLAYPDLLRGLLRRRLRYVYMSFHAGEPTVHNSLVRRDSFAIARKAVENLRGHGLDLMLNCVVTSRNVDHLRGLVDEFADCDDLTLKFSMVEPKGGARHAFARLVPEVSEAAARVRDAIEYGRTLGTGGPRLAHGGLPLCLLPGVEDQYDDLRTHRYWSMVEVGEPDFFVVDDANHVKPDATCRDCAARGPCPGLFRAYHEAHGESELRPVAAGPRSNAFDWVFEALVTEHFEAQQGCPLLHGSVTPWDRSRHLFVRNDRRIGRYRSDTRDFDDDQITEVKFTTGQIYLDASSKLAPDDFGRDLVKLERSPLCRDCPRVAECTGLFEPRFDDVFDRDDRRVVELLGALEGSVVDLGAGEGRYCDVLRRRVAAGAIRYLAVEPDGVAAAALRARWPGVEIDETPAEKWDPAEAAEHLTDHVVILRSWNHLRDPRAVLERVRAALRQGGTLTVVDNVVFGLARTAVQTQRARRGAAGFEHRRNDDSTAAHRRIAAAGFELVERADVGPATSNQWLLRYRFDTLAEHERA